VALDTAVIEAEVRFLLGGLEEATLSSAIMQMIIGRGIAKYGDADTNSCTVTYYTVLESLRYMSRQSAAGSAGTAASGAIKRQKEKEGNITYEVEYDVSGTSGTTASWDTLLNDFLENPQYVCDELVETTSSGSGGYVMIGGVSHSERERVNNNVDSVNGWSDNLTSYDKVFQSRDKTYW